ncbi:MAG: hypothetical protein ABS61_03050 [Microbacterium sp. SCN 70-18]|nr:diguanylate cyclase [Microbacterium chocolatum]ODT11507.1 MAG: hypothetical protein ABS61_03050 [Microbacterium sp. SCN 70-18]
MTDILAALAASNLGIWQAFFTAVATIVTVGIAFLSAPSRATLYWTYAFTLSMISTFGVIAAESNQNEVARTFMLGLLLGAPALLWSGFRAHRGVRTFVWVGPVFALLAATTLALVAAGPAFATTYRALYFLSAISAGLFLWEWVRMPERREAVIWPLGVAAVIFVATGLAGVIVSVAFRPVDVDFAVSRPLASVGMLVYIASALIAILGLSVGRTRRGQNPRREAQYREFQEAARERLARALPASELCSVLILRLDDLRQVLATTGPAQVASLVNAFDEKVREVVGSGGLVGMTSDSDLVVLVAKPEGATRDLLRRILRSVGDLEFDTRIPVQPSASAGWCSTTVGGYDLDALVFIARGAAEVAQERGGDQWERADGTFIERLVTGLEER